VKTTDDILEVLAGLTDRDRQWIVERLTPRARNTLLQQRADLSTELPGLLTGANRPAESSSKSFDNLAKDSVLASVNIDQLVNMLVQEPAWISHALIQREWSWRAELLRALPTGHRNEVERLSAAGARYSERVVDVLIGLMSQAVRVESPKERTYFDTLVRKIALRPSFPRFGMRT
jgi:hypothetical protein